MIMRLNRKVILLLATSLAVVSTTITNRHGGVTAALAILPNNNKLRSSTAARTNTLPKLNMNIESIVQGTRGGEEEGEEGTATIPNEVFNLVKSIVGAGVLSLPAGTLVDKMNGKTSGTDLPNQ
jgi:hypothetical protein